jgi:uncharacterized membrane protein
MIETAHLHPMLVHFPISLITVGFFADLLYLIYKKDWLSNTSFFLLILGTLGAIAAVTTGLFFTSEPTEGEVVGIFEIHERSGIITLILLIILSAIRIWLSRKSDKKPYFQWILFILYFLAMSAVSFTGYMGGKMVYSYFLGI